MAETTPTTRFRFWLWLIALVGVLVPRRLRADWRQEWEAELRHRELLLAEWDKLTWRHKLDLLWRSIGAFWDALCLQPRRLEDEMLQDLRFGLRMLRKKPGFTLVAVFTLALGVGANTAIFSVVNAVLLQPLLFAKADELVVISRTRGGEERWPFPPAAYLDLKRRNTVFAGVAALSNKGWPANLTGAGDPERLQGYQVSANLFPLLGAAAESGRTFLDEEDRPGGNRVVVLSHELWVRRFGGDKQIIGRALTLNGAAYTVVGVMPADFRFYAKTDLWTPLALTVGEEHERGASYLNLIGRRQPGVSIAQAGAEAETISRAFFNAPDSEVRTILDAPQAMLTQEVRPLLLLLFAAVGFVLLIACANVANLLLARANARRGELAIRSALGAGRARIARQLFVESALLAMLGGAGGLLLANWGMQFLAGGLPEYLAAANSRLGMLKLDATALGFTFGLSLLTTVFFGLAPAVELSKINLNEALKESARTGGGRSRLRSILVVAEVALATVLLVSAGLMIKSFWRLAHVNPGFEPAGALTARVDPSSAKYKEVAQVNAFYQSFLERVSATPDVRYAGMINSLNATNHFTVDEHPPVAPERRPLAAVNQVSADYFRAMGIPLRVGRFLTDRDVGGAPPVVVIDETLARLFFPGEDPIGKHAKMWNKSWQIVGVVGAAKYGSLSEESSPHMYFSYLQENWRSMSLVVRAQTGDPASLTASIRGALAAIDPDQPIHSFQTLEAQVSERITPQRFTTLLLGGFAILAALLAAVGIYGVMSFAVAQRTREIGIRIALGAQARQVMNLVMRQGMIMVLAGVTMGLAASFALTRLLSSLLFGVGTADVATLLATTLLLGVVALAACFIPARRATRVDPVTALRNE